MATEYPPLGKSYVISYSNGDKDFPIIAIKKDPRVDNYRRPDDLSPHPDSTRYPNHVFTGTQPTNTDERVIWIYEILPSPWIPFTRYDDDLGPVQGRRRSVANTGQQATLGRDKKVSYEAREGSAIVSTELEETWDAGSTDPDEPSPFPIKDRDVYDPSRGAVQERRQLVSTTGDEVATLENNNGIITETSYEAYNEYLSFKIVRTYSVDGPKLVGRATNNEGQLVTVTTQRKAAENYEPPLPTATKTVEVSREDIETVVERVVEAPSLFVGQSIQQTKADLTPQKFKAAIIERVSEFNEAGTAGGFDITDQIGVFARSERQVNEFVKRVSVASRTTATTPQLISKTFTSDLGGGIATITETLANDSDIDGNPTGNPTLDSQSVKAQISGVGIGYKTGLLSAEAEALGDGRFIKRISLLPSLEELKGLDYDETLDVRLPFTQKIVNAKEPFPESGAISIQPRDVANSVYREYDVTTFGDQIEDYYREIPDLANVNLPNRLVSATVIFSRAQGSQGGDGEGSSFYYKSGGSSSLAGEIVYDVEEGYSGSVPATRYIFFLPQNESSIRDVVNKIRQKDADAGRKLTKYYPNVRPKSHMITIVGGSVSSDGSRSVSVNSSSSSGSRSASVAVGTSRTPATIHPIIPITIFTATPDSYSSGAGSVTISDQITARILVSGSIPSNNQDYTTQWEEPKDPTIPTKDPAIPATDFPEFPDGRYLIAVNAAPYRFGFIRVEALVADIFSPYVGNNAELIDPEYDPIIPVPQAPDSPDGGIRPSQPKNLTASTVGSTQFQVSWDFVDYANYYFVDVSTNSSFTSFVTGYQNKQLGLTSLLISGLTPQTTYYVRVRAENGAGSSFYSATLTQATAPS